jgi:hypothetical protein
MNFSIVCNACKTISEAGKAYWHLQTCVEYAHVQAIIEDARRSANVRV